MNINYFDDEPNNKQKVVTTLKEAPTLTPTQQKTYDDFVSRNNSRQTMSVNIPKSMNTPSLNNSAASMFNSPKTPSPTLTLPTNIEKPKAVPAPLAKPSAQTPVIIKKDEPKAVQIPLAKNQDKPVVTTKASEPKSDFNGKGMFRKDAPFIDPFKTPDQITPKRDIGAEFASAQNDVKKGDMPKRDIGAEFSAARGDKPAPNVPMAKIKTGGRDVGREFDEIQNPEKYKGIPDPITKKTKDPLDDYKNVPYAKTVKKGTNAQVTGKPVNPNGKDPYAISPGTESNKEKPQSLVDKLRAFGDKVPKNKEELKAFGKKATDFAQTPTGTAISGAAAGALAIKLISDSLKKKEWYNEKCQGISNARKKAECLNYVSNRMRGDLRKKLKRCKHSNNPAKCESIIMDKLNSM